jgi:RNA polymerase sigma factor (sigma-70 family)
MPVASNAAPSRRPALAASDLEPAEVLPLVRGIAQGFHSRFPDLELEHLVSWGSVAAVEALESYDPVRNGSVAAWVSVKVRWGILDRLRVLESPAGRPGRSLAGLELEAPDSLPGRIESEDFIAWAAAGLPRSEASIVRLRYLYGFTGKEIARVLGFHEGWVSDLHQKALEAIRRKIQEER